MKTQGMLIMLSISLMVACTMKPDGENQRNSRAVNAGEQKVDSLELTNNFYDNEPSYDLKTLPVYVEGEISNPGQVDYSGLQKHSVIVKETLQDGENNRFVGAYRYDGYSLFDILSECQLKKANEAEFKPVIDLYVIIENQDGEKVVFSWGEIYYPNHLHDIIIADQVMRIVPSKTKDLWPLPENAKVIAANDLITERNIEKPVKITIKSAGHSFEINRDINPLFSPKVEIYRDGQMITSLSEIHPGTDFLTYESVFYGRGRGIHSTTPFTGVPFKKLTSDQIELTRSKLCRGIVLYASIDGYRTVFSFSEIYNRNDHSEVLVIYDPDNKDGGAFRLFPAGDFFSDRAIKAIKSVYLEEIK